MQGAIQTKPTTYPTVSAALFAKTSVVEYENQLNQIDYSPAYFRNGDDIALLVVATLFSGFLNLIPLGLMYAYDRCIAIPNIKKRANDNYKALRKRTLAELHELRAVNKGNLDKVKEVVIPFSAGGETHSLQITQTWENGRAKLSGQVYLGNINGKSVKECNELRTGSPITLPNINLENLYCDLLSTDTTTILDEDSAESNEQIMAEGARNNELMHLNFTYTPTTAYSFTRLKQHYSDYFSEKYQTKINLFEAKLDEKKFIDELSHFQLLSGTSNAKEALELAFSVETPDLVCTKPAQVSILQKTTIDPESTDSPPIWVLTLSSTSKKVTGTSGEKSDLLNHQLRDIEAAAYRCGSRRVILNPDLQQLAEEIPDAAQRFAELVERMQQSGIIVHFYDKKISHKNSENGISESKFSAQHFWDDVNQHLQHHELTPVSDLKLGRGWSRTNDLIINNKELHSPVGKDSNPHSFNNQLGEKSTIHAIYTAAYKGKSTEAPSREVAVQPAAKSAQERINVESDSDS